MALPLSTTNDKIGTPHILTSKCGLTMAVNLMAANLKGHSQLHIAVWRNKKYCHDFPIIYMAPLCHECQKLPTLCSFTWHFYRLDVPVVHFIKELLLLFKLSLASWDSHFTEVGRKGGGSILHQKSEISGLPLLSQACNCSPTDAKKLFKFVSQNLIYLKADGWQNKKKGH